MTFEIIKDQFVKDGQPIKLISGAVHYFRNMPDTWRDIFKKMKAMGLNCVETYCAWNMHEKKPGEFDFKGNLDIAAFILFGDVEVTVHSATELLKRLPEFDFIVTPEAKSIPLAYEMARQSGKKYFVARKKPKLYMKIWQL